MEMTVNVESETNQSKIDTCVASGSNNSSGSGSGSSSSNNNSNNGASDSDSYIWSDQFETTKIQDTKQTSDQSKKVSNQSPTPRH